MSDHSNQITSLPRNSRVGVAVTQNQTVQLLKYCDVVLALDKRAVVPHEHKKVLFVYSNSFINYLYNFVFIFCELMKSNRELLVYCDIIAKMKSLNINKIRNELGRFTKPIYVSNLNSPLIHYLTNKISSDLVWAHIPHAAIGNTVLPDPNLVSLYFAYNKTELEQIKMLARRTRCLQISVSTSEHLIKSCNRQCCLVLPKNIWDVDLSRLPTDRSVSWHIKYHPASNIWQKLIWSLRFTIVMRSIPTVDKLLNLKLKMYSCSSSVVFELLNSGKCVYKLPMINEGIDHYNIDRHLLETSEAETLETLRNQQAKILGIS